MNRRFSIFTLLIGLFVVSLFVRGETKSASVEKDSFAIDRNSSDVYFFYGQGCPHCAKVEPFLVKMEQKYPLQVHRFDVYNNRSCLSLFDKYSNMYGLSLERRGVPTVFVSDTYFVGDRSILDDFEEAVGKALNQRSLADQAVEVESPEGSNWGGMCITGGLSIVTITVAALVDSISPCSIAILLFLVGARVLVANRRKRALKVGLAFCLSVFIAYFLFGLGLFTVVQVSGFSGIFSLLVGLVAVLAGIFYLKDAFRYGSGGFVMEVPRSLKPLLMKMLKGVTSPFGAFATGFIVCLFELPCTGGPYLVILSQLANSATKLQAIPWLVYYNFIFVLPLILICLFLYSGFLSIGNARGWNEKNKYGLKLVGGFVLIAAGILVTPVSQVLQLVQSFLSVFRVVGPFLIPPMFLYCFGSLAKENLSGKVAKRWVQTLLLSIAVVTALILPSPLILLPPAHASPARRTCYIQWDEYQHVEYTDDKAVGYASNGSQAEDWCAVWIDNDVCDWGLGVLISPLVDDDIADMPICAQVGAIYRDIIKNDTTLDGDLFCSGHGLIINSNHTTLDCNGHSLTGMQGHSGIGIVLDNVEDVTIKNCNVTGWRYAGIYTKSSSNNTIYHNNFMNNLQQVRADESANTWDDSYPSGGNYWSNHACTGNPSTGLQPYIIDDNNVDHYPFEDPGGWLLPAKNADLSVSSPDISFSDSNPSENKTIVISANVHNLGDENAENVVVRFVDATMLLGEERISYLSHHSQSQVAIEWTAQGEGYHLIKTIVDPDGSIAETDETNNEATRSILVGNYAGYGGIVAAGNLSTYETLPGSFIDAYGYASYNTTYGAGEPVAGATVTITVLGNTRQWTTHTIDSGEYRQQITAPYYAGNFTVVVTVSDGTFFESIELPLTVLQPPEGVDLTLSSTDILFLPLDPLESGNATIMAAIHNIGSLNASEVPASFFVDGNLVANRTIDFIPAHGTETISAWWIFTSGTHNITVTVDLNNSIAELNEDNNQASRNLYVYPGSPDPTPIDIHFSDSMPTVNQNIMITAEVKNIGGLDVSNLTVAFYDDDNLIGEGTIRYIQGKGGAATTSLDHAFANEGYHTIKVLVDPYHNVSEADEDNNLYSEDIFVHLPSPDLTLTYSDIAFSKHNPLNGTEVIVYAKIHNVGELDAENVDVDFLDGDTEISLISMPLVANGSYQTVNVTWIATPPGFHSIKVRIDPNNNIKETDENNNIATRSIYVYPPPEQPVPDLAIYHEDIVFSNTNPDPSEHVTIYATIHNIGEGPAQNIPVIFYVEDVQIGPAQTITSLPVNENVTLTTSWIASELGSHVVRVEIDPGYIITESNRNNNVATRAIIVGEFHNIALYSVMLSKTIVGQGYSMDTSVTVVNQGRFTETFNVTIYANQTVIGEMRNIDLTSENITNIAFTWNTTGFVKGNYTISACATPVLGETETTDNTLTDGWVFVSIPGDINADRKVDLKDVFAVGKAFGTTRQGPNPPGRLYSPNCDINDDGKIDLKDYYATCKNYGKSW